jgi:hypothetical protein
MVTMHHGIPGLVGTLQPHSPDGDHRGQLLQSRCQPLPVFCARTHGQAGGLIRLSGRIPQGGDTQSIILSPGQRPRPADPGKAGCPRPSPGRHGLVISRRKVSTENQYPPAHPAPPCPAARHDLLPGGRVKDASGAGYAGRAPARSLTRTRPLAEPAAIRGREQA